MGFEYIPLGEVSEVTKLAGFEFTKYINYNDTGEIIALRALNLRHGELDLTDIKRIDKAVSDSLPRSKLFTGDILLTYTGNGYGDCAIITDNNKYHLAPNICKITPNAEKIDPYFLYSYIRSHEFYQQMSNHMVGSSQPTIPMKTIRQLKVPVPDLEEQKKIKMVVMAIDEKIRVNRQINDNLQQQIVSIFNSQYAPSLRLANWTVGTVGDVVTLQRGYDLPKDKMIHGSYPVAGSTDTIFYHNDFTTEAPCIVMGRSGNIGNPRLYMEKCWAHNTTLFVKDFKSNNPYWSYYMLRAIDYSQFRGGSAVPTLNRNHVHSFEIAIPPINQQNEFAERILPLLLLIENNRVEINALSELRDSILPQLMSGALDISAIHV